MPRIWKKSQKCAAGAKRLTTTGLRYFVNVLKILAEEHLCRFDIKKNKYSTTYLINKNSGLQCEARSA